jgi:hypothetical protein
VTYLGKRKERVSMLWVTCPRKGLIVMGDLPKKEKKEKKRLKETS